MAEYKQTKTKAKDKYEPAEGTDEYRLKTDFLNDLTNHDSYVSDYDAYEAMVISKTWDSISRQTKSGITDGSTTTLYLERAGRVVGQLPTGVVKAAGIKDKGLGLIMDLIRQRYIYPNANAQHNFLIKLRLWQFYSSVYGHMPMFYDWNVAPSGYIGPDCWLWNPRNFVPQQGRTSVNDMDYAHAISYIGSKQIDQMIERGGWNNEELERLKAMARESSKDNDPERDTLVKRLRNSNPVSDQVCLVTRFESGPEGKWVTFAPDYGCLILRSIPNPHKSGRIPFIIKYSQPLFDSFYGLGDFQRAKPIQFAMDGLTNFYFEGIKINIFPPTVVLANGVIKRTIGMKAGNVWQETIPNSVRRLETSTAGLSTYQSAMSQMKGSLLNQAGTTDTATNAESANDPGFGRTPEALEHLASRENTRDNQDRFYLEQAVGELLDEMLNLIPRIGTESIPLDLFADEVGAMVAAGYKDIERFLETSESGQYAKLTVKPSDLKGLSYRFYIDAGSTVKEDRAEKRKAIVEFLGLIGKFQNELENLRESTGMGVDWAQLFKLYGHLLDTPELDNIFTRVSAPAPATPPAGAATPTPAPAPAPVEVGGLPFNNPELAARAANFLNLGGQNAPTRPTVRSTGGRPAPVAG